MAPSVSLSQKRTKRTQRCRQCQLQGKGLSHPPSHDRTGGIKRAKGAGGIAEVGPKQKAPVVSARIFTGGLGE